MINNLEIKKNTDISVVIPVWNGEKTLEATIKSCLNQTLSPLEILICDDGSTDNSKHIVENINDNKVIWVPGNHSGSPAGPRNRGLKISKGEWIAFCDSDDEWLPNKLEKQITALKKSNCRASCTNAIRKVNDIKMLDIMIKYKKAKISFSDLLNSNNIVCSSSMVKRSILEEVGGFSETIEHGSYADFICWLRVTTQTDFAFVNEPLVIYDDHPQTSIRANETSAERLKMIALDNFTIWSKQENMPYFRYLIKKHTLIRNLLKLIKKIFYV
ncbi:MAG: glycosyltransferase family 2 protein [Patescibacteria group bacterium]